MKEEIFINFTNHPSDNWGAEQREASHQYGRIIDIPFPAVDADGDEAYIQELAEKYEQQILRWEPAAVMCQGEFCLAFAVVERLKAKGVVVLAACSERMVTEEDGKRIAVFSFRRFRRF